MVGMMIIVELSLLEVTGGGGVGKGIYLFIHLFIYFIYLFIYLFMYLFIYLFIYSFIHLGMTQRHKPIEVISRMRE